MAIESRVMARCFGRDQADYEVEARSPESLAWELENAAYATWTHQEREVSFPYFADAMEGYTEALETAIEKATT